MSTNSISALKGICITPPVIGRISIGHVEVRPDGKAIPQKDDYIKVTTLVQREDRSWEPHPIQQQLNGADIADANDATAQEKLISIPIRIAYDNPQLSLNSSYSCFEFGSGRMLCTSDGEMARRSTDNGVVTMSCPRPKECEFGKKNQCKIMIRFYFQIEGQDDDLGVFILRSKSENSFNAISGRIAMWHGGMNGKIAGLPLLLTLKAKTTTASFPDPIYYVDLVDRPGMSRGEAIKAARKYQREVSEAEFNAEGMEQALIAGLANSAFAEQLEDADEWISDDALIGRAEQNLGLRRSGIRGLDNLMKNLVPEHAAATVMLKSALASAGAANPDNLIDDDTVSAECDGAPSIVTPQEIVGETVAPALEATVLAISQAATLPDVSNASAPPPPTDSASEPVKRISTVLEVVVAAGASIDLPWTQDDCLAVAMP